MDLELIQSKNFIDMGDTEEGLRTAVIMSLFTDQRVSEDELPEGDEFRGGFWGDVFEENSIGSKLWLLNRAKITRETKNRAEEYAYEALEWMIEDQLVTDISVIGFFEDNNLGIEIELTLPNKTSVNQKFNRIISSERSRGK